MIIKATHRFLRDLEKIKSVEIIDEVDFALSQIENAGQPQNIAGFKPFKKFKGYGRIRISDYRIGVQFSGETMILKCMLHRSVVYKNFP